MPADNFIRRIGRGVANTTRNIVQAIPGGAQAFPLEANGTVNWIPGRGQGPSVAGAMVRGAIDPTGMVLNNSTFGNGPMAEPGGPSRTASAQASARPGVGGSVVGRGFIGAQASGPGRGDAIHADGGESAPGPYASAQAGAGGRAGVGNAGGNAAYVPGSAGRSARGSMATQTLGSELSMREMNERMASRGGLLAER